MTALQRLISYVGNALILAVLLGLIVRKRYASCYSFAPYLVIVLVPELVMALWPERFFRWDFWILKEAALNLLKFAIALELALRAFRAFPGARATARRVLFGVLAVTYLGVLAVPVQTANYAIQASQVQIRILNGTVWLFTGISALILWYRLPVEPMQKAILIGFVPYLLVFTVAMNALEAFGWHLREYASYAQALAYVLLTGYWCRAVWRPEVTTRRTALADMTEPSS